MKLKGIIAVILVLLLAACGSSSNTGVTNSIENTASTTAATTTEAATTTTEVTTTTTTSTASSVQETTTVTTTKAETSTNEAVETVTTEDKKITVDTLPGTLPIVNEKMTLSFFWPADATVLGYITDFNDNPTWQAIEEETNIHIEWFHGGAEQRTIMINSGDLTDMIWDANTYPGGLDKAIEDGAYLRLNELMEQYAPTYMGLLNANPDMKLDAMSDLGNIAAFGMLEDIVQGPYIGIGVRQDWLNELGLEHPVTYDDWHTVLSAFKNDLGIPGPLSLYSDIVKGHGWENGEWSGGFGVIARHYQVDGEVKYGPIEPGFREYITLMAQWYAEGLIDPEFSTRKWEDYDRLKYTNYSGAWHTGFWLLEYHKVNAEDPNYYEVAVPSPVLMEGDVNHFRQTNRKYRSGHECVVTTMCKNPEIAVRWLDNLYTDKNYTLTNYGIEGQSYNVTSDGEFIFTDLIVRNPELSVGQAMNIYLVHSGPMRRMWWREQATYTDDERACEEIWYTADDAYMIPATTTFTPDEGNRFTVIMSDIETYVQEKSLAFITGSESLSNFDAFVEQIISMNIEEANAIKQAALDRYYNRE